MEYKELKLISEKLNLYEPNLYFYLAMFLQVIFLELTTITLLYISGHSLWLTYLIAILCQTLAFV